MTIPALVAFKCSKDHDHEWTESQLVGAHLDEGGRVFYATCPNVVQPSCPNCGAEGMPDHIRRFEGRATVVPVGRLSLFVHAARGFFAPRSWKTFHFYKPGAVVGIQLPEPSVDTQLQWFPTVEAAVDAAVADLPPHLRELAAG